MIVGRLAPSPTGAQHLGNARTYLLAWLAARSQGGKVILRIEDIDSPRVKAWAIQQAIDDLAWLGLDWDEGPTRQTERCALYDRALEALKESGKVYPCTCSRTDIANAASAPHQGQEGPVYPGTCATRSVEAFGLCADEYCWRFRSGDKRIEFDDWVAGHQACVPAREFGDFPVTRKGGMAAYQLAVVVDDALMGVNQVVRGDDLLPSTYRQLEIYSALGYAPPQFAHVPLVVGADGRRLAKRHGDTRLSHYREMGIRAEQIIGWAAFTSGLIPSEEEVAPRDLLNTFCWDKISREQTVVSGEMWGIQSD